MKRTGRQREDRKTKREGQVDKVRRTSRDNIFFNLIEKLSYFKIYINFKFAFSEKDIYVKCLFLEV